MPDPKTMQELTPEQRDWMRKRAKEMTEEEEERLLATLADLEENHRALEER